MMLLKGLEWSSSGALTLQNFVRSGEAGFANVCRRGYVLENGMLHFVYSNTKSSSRVDVLLTNLLLWRNLKGFL